MAQEEEKQLLLKDLCARLPYGVKLLYNSDSIARIKDRVEILRGVTIGYTIWYETNYIHSEYDSTSGSYKHFKPYLRPMSSMTIEEGERLEQIAKETLGDFMFEAEEDGGAIYHMGTWKILSPAMFDYLNSIHIDYRGLIEMDLALEAPERMYNL